MTVQPNLMEKISSWTRGELPDAALVEAIEAAAEDAAEHRSGFGAVVDDLTAEQQDRCAELVQFAFSLLDTLDQEMQEVLDAVEAEDKARVIAAGDMLARASFQLNQAFMEFRHQALAALGPTEIPNLNQLIAAKGRYLENPTEEARAQLQEAIDVERVVAKDGARALVKEPQIAEVVSLTNAFMAHLGQLNRLSEDLQSAGAATDFASHLALLEGSYRELSQLVPMVTVALRAQGETEFPDLNYLLTMITEAVTGSISDAPLIEALQAVEAGFSQTYEKLKQAHPVMESVLAKEEIENACRAFDEDFRKGVESVYRFLVERETIWMTEAHGTLLDFARRLSAHKERLKELEALEGKVTCPRCSTVNEQERQRCSQCGFHLPQNIAATATSTFQTKEAGGLAVEDESELLVTANMAKLYEAINAVHEGRLDDESFLAEVDKFELLVNANVTSLPEEPTVGDPGQQQAVNRVYDTFEEGIDRFHQGIEMMRQFVETREEETLREAVRTLDQGAKKIAEAGQAVVS